MKYHDIIPLKDGRTCILRNGTEEDRQASLDHFILTHGQTDYLLSYPDEIQMTAEEQGQYLREKTESENEVEILAFVDGVLVGTAGLDALGKQEKLRHRCEFGLCVDQAYWGLGIGTALLHACIRCARQAGYRQIELQVVDDNEPAIRMYQKAGFKEYGRNPMAFLSRHSGYQTLILMRLSLDCPPSGQTAGTS